MRWWLPPDRHLWGWLTDADGVEVVADAKVDRGTGPEAVGGTLLAEIG